MFSSTAGQLKSSVATLKPAAIAEPSAVAEQAPVLSASAPMASPSFASSTPAATTAISQASAQANSEVQAQAQADAIMELANQQAGGDLSKLDQKEQQRIIDQVSTA